MCLGDMTTSKQVQSNQTSAPPAWLSDAAQGNVNFATNLQNTGFTPYTGQQVAGFSPQQSTSFGMGNDVANSVNGGPIGSALNNYTTAGPQSVSPETISSQMSPYMNQYVSQALAPQLELQDQQFASQNKNFDSAATGAGAFGDTGWGLGRSNLTTQQNIGRTGLIGNAYNAAFNTAIGAGAQDVSNNLTGQTTNASLAETALGRQLTGAQAQQTAGTGATNLENTLGGQQTAQSQADLNAKFNQWLMAQQYPFQTIQASDSAIAAGKAGAPVTTTGTQTTQAPDNSGYGLIGSLAGAMFAADGGSVPAGKPVVVGERGPELLYPGTDSVVVPNEVLEAAREKRAKKSNSDEPNFTFGLAA